MHIEKRTTDDELVAAICGASAERNRALRTFFEDKSLKASVEKLVIRNSGNRSDAEDLFQETLLIFDRNIRSQQFKGDSSLRTYFIGIAKWTWWNHRRKKENCLKVIELDHQIHGLAEKTEHYDELDAYTRHHLTVALEPLGKKCQQLIMALYEDYDYKEVEETTELGTAEAIRKDLWRCRQRFMQLLEEKPSLFHFLKPILKK